MLGYSPTMLANMIGMSYQQEYKYERGIIRIPVACLNDIAKALGVPIGYFFEGLGEGNPDLTKRQRMCLEMARNFSAITDEKHRDKP